MKKLKYLTLLLAVNISSTFAATTDLNVSLGNLCEYVGQIQTNESGEKNFCSFLPSFSGSLDIFLTPEFALSPQLGATLPKSGRDENVKRMTMYALINSKYKTSYVNLFGGAGLYFTRISGPGGDAQLNNGNGVDSFPLPNDAVYTRNFILNLGVGFDFTKEVSAELYTYLFNALKSEERAFSLGLQATYHFGDIQ